MNTRVHLVASNLCKQDKQELPSQKNPTSIQTSVYAPQTKDSQCSTNFETTESEDENYHFSDQQGPISVNGLH